MKKKRIDNFSTLEKIYYKVARNYLSDEKYAYMSLKRWDNPTPSITKPETFNEKIRYLMLNDKSKIQTILADKYRAKYYVESEIGKKYIIKTIAKWDKPSEIDFNELKTKCMLKTNHTSGGNSKYEPNIDCEKEIRRKMRKFFNKNQYKV